MTIKAFAAAALILAMSGAAAGQQGTVPENRLIEWLSGSQQAAKEAVVAHILAMAPAERSPELVLAVARELERVNDWLRQRSARIRAGASESSSGRIVEYRGTLVQILAQSSDPRVIPALAGAVDGGPLAYRAVAKFGEPAVDVLVRAAKGEKYRSVFSIAWSLRALMLILDSTQISPSASAQIVEVASMRLRGRQEALVVEAACELAVATGDASLRSRVVQVANNPVALIEMGISDPRMIGKVQKAATRALQGR